MNTAVKKKVLAALVCSMMLVGQLSAQGLSSAESAVGENGFSLGYVLGYAGEFFLGDLSDFVPQTHGFWAGGTAGYKAFTATLEASMGFGTLEAPFVHNGPWLMSDKVMTGQVGLTFDYALYNSDYLSISPLAGVAACSLINAELDETSVNDLRVVVGGQIDWKILRGASEQIELFGLLPMKVKMDSGLRLRVFMARNFYEDPCAGNSLNVSLGWYQKL